MVDEFVGVWRKFEVKTGRDFSFFYINITERNGNYVTGAGFDKLGLFDLEGEIGIGATISKKYDYSKGMPIKYQCSVDSSGEDVQGTWKMIESAGTFCMVAVSNFNHDNDRKDALGRILLECEAAVSNWKIKEHREEFPFSPKF